MRADTIKLGDCLRLKRDNPYGFSETALWEVLEIKTRDGYKTPWLLCSDGAIKGHFRPSDFRKRS